MSNNQDQQYAHYTKMAWIIYAVMTVVIVAVLVLFVATDNEERFFYGIMPAAAAYVLRPTDKVMAKYIKKFTGVSQPTKPE